MKRLLYWLGAIDLVWTQDRDGQLRLRVVYHADGKRFVYGIATRSIDKGNYNELLLDGTCVGSVNYMKRWYPYRHKPAEKKFDRPVSERLTIWKG